MTWWASRRRPKRREVAQSLPARQGCQARQRPSRPPAAPLRGCCASLDRRRRPRPRNRVGAGNIQGKCAAAGVERETDHAMLVPCKRLITVATLGACWTPLLSCQPACVPCCSQALQRPIFPSLTAVSASPPVKPLSVRPAGGVWSKVGALSAPTPFRGHGAQGRSGMPKAPRSGGSQRRTSLTVPSTVALASPTELSDQLQEVSFYRTYIGGLNRLFASRS